MKALIIIFNILLMSSFDAFILTNSEKPSRSLVEVALDTCPSLYGLNQMIIEDFLTDSVWATQRIESNTEGLMVTQITVLVDSSQSNVCNSFNDIYEESFDEKNGLGETANNITYFKAGNFYFVIITPRQSDNPDYITFGVNFLHIYDQNIHLVKAYAF